MLSQKANEEPISERVISIEGTFVVCTYNGHSRINKVLEHLQFQSGSWPILIVDNASNPPIKHAINEELSSALEGRLKIVTESVPGLMNARKKGIREADTALICFVDDDNMLCPDYAFYAAKVFQRHPTLGAVGGCALPPENTVIPEFLRGFEKAYAIGRLASENGVLKRGDTVWGAGMVCSRVALLALLDSGWNPVLVGRKGSLQLTGDDTEMLLALTLAGYRIYFEDRCRLVHEIDSSRFTLEKLASVYASVGAATPAINEYRKRLLGRKYFAYSLRYALPIQVSVEIVRMLWHFVCSKVFQQQQTGTKHMLYYRLRREKLLSLVGRRKLVFGAHVAAEKCANLATSQRVDDGTSQHSNNLLG